MVEYKDITISGQYSLPYRLNEIHPIFQAKYQIINTYTNIMIMLRASIIALSNLKFK
jgi:hypothetical protein